MADRYTRMLEKWDAIEAEVSIAEAARISVGAVVLDLENAAYQFAKTMPQWPHWYTLRREWEGALSFGVVIAAIHRYGEDGVFQGTPRRYLHANGWKYWSMIDPHAGSVATILVNRAPGDRRRRPHDRVPDWDPRLEPLARQYARSGQVLDVGWRWGRGTDRRREDSGGSIHRDQRDAAGDRGDVPRTPPLCDTNPTHAPDGSVAPVRFRPDLAAWGRAPAGRGTARLVPCWRQEGPCWHRTLPSRASPA